jgi:L-iditol 2-dehydrogenase
MKNRVAYVTGPLKLEFAEIDLPKLRPGHVLVKPHMVGLCGSDVDMFAGRIGYIKTGQLRYPFVPGHEFFGDIVELGSGVTNYKIGDLITCECHLPCGFCDNCRTGRYNLCRNMSRLGLSNNYPGALATYIEVPAKDTHKIPACLTPDEAVLIEPVAVASYAAERAGVKGGDNVLILGPGPIGLLTTSVCKASGAANIVVAGRADTSRLKLALKMGATKTVLFDSGEMKFYEDWADTVIEATGQPSVVAQGLKYSKKGGTFCSIALHNRPIENFDYSQVVLREVQIRGGIGSPRIWSKSIAMMEAGLIKPTPIISNRFPFSELDKAMHLAYDRTESVIKTVIFMDE